ncbi:MAG: endonuclease [Rhodobacteraceae bacterium]|nr:MAG: endonuclease [Paracoccaceae bacterium]
MIRVASYNIRKSVGLDRKRRPERIVEILNEINADVVALQEVDRRTGLRETTIPREMIEAETDLKVVEIATRPDSIGWHGNAILVRKDAEVMVERRHDIPVLEPRGAISTDIFLHGEHFRIVGMHLALMRTYRRQQIRAVTSQIQRLNAQIPTLIMGDLNEWRPGGSLDEFGDEYAIATPGPSFHSSRPVASLDRIILRNDLDLLKGAVHHSDLSRVASDHLPIYADIKVSQSSIA